MALMTYEQLDRSIDADSDSEDELAEQVHLYRSKFFSFVLYDLTCSYNPSGNREGEGVHVSGRSCQRW